MWATSFYEFLRNAVGDRGNRSFEEVAAMAERESDLEIKGPCFAALACWGDEGFAKMIEIAVRKETSKDTSAAIKMLALVAAGKPISSGSAFFHDEAALKQINDLLSEANLAVVARRRLSELIMTIPADDLLIPLGTAFTQLALTDPDIVGEIVHALSSKWLSFGPSELDEYERLLEQRPEDEPSLHAFFERYPQMLDPMVVQVWSKPDFHGYNEPDFLIRRSDNSYLVIEIEHAAKPIMTQADQPSAYVTQAVRQVNDYRSFLLERLVEARHFFPHIDDPDCLVVIGLENQLLPSQASALQQENRSRNKLRIVGFDWILRRARAVLTNVTTAKVEVVRNFRVV
jgi:Domain of unknown function (DUF4263)